MVLEIAFGACFGVFGIGHIYAGRVGLGLALTIGYWAIQLINIIMLSWLCGVGFLSANICHVMAIFLPAALMVLSR